LYRIRHQNQPLNTGRTHREQLPTEPKNWRKMKRHPLKQRVPHLWLKKLVTEMGLCQISKSLVSLLMINLFINNIVILFHPGNQSKSQKSLPGSYVEKIADRFNFRTVKPPRTTDPFEKQLAATTREIQKRKKFSTKG
jgi:hypothetical protein